MSFMPLTINITERHVLSLIPVLIPLSSYLPAHQAGFLPRSRSSWGERTWGCVWALRALSVMCNYARKREAWQEDMELFSSRKVQAQPQNLVLLSKLYMLKIFVSTFFSMYICFKPVTVSLNLISTEPSSCPCAVLQWNVSPAAVTAEHSDKCSSPPQKKKSHLCRVAGGDPSHVLPLSAHHPL